MNNESREFYRAVEEASQRCQPAESTLPLPELEDAQIAEATSRAAMKNSFRANCVEKR